MHGKSPRAFANGFCGTEYAPHIENGVWDGYSVEDDGSGQFRAWLERDSGPSAPDDGPRTAVLTGSLEKQMPRWLRKDFGEW